MLIEANQDNLLGIASQRIKMYQYCKKMSAFPYAFTVLAC